MLQIPIWLDLSAVIVGALAGVWAAQERKLDLVGYIGLSFLCGLGGGLVRDMAMQVGSVYMLQSPYAIPFVITTGIVGYFFPQFIKRYPNLLDWLDILSVGLFVVAGTDKAINYNLYPIACMLMGVITGVGGGMMAHYYTYMVPNVFNATVSNNLLTSVVLGGVSSVTGPSLGTAILTFTPEVLRFLSNWRLAIYGLVLVIIMRVRPEGLLGYKEVYQPVVRLMKRGIGKIKGSRASGSKEG